MADILAGYMRAFSITASQDILFNNSRQKKLTKADVHYIVSKYVCLGQKQAPDLFRQRITNHSFRHSKAMHLLEAGVNLIYIRDFLGHSSVTMTEIYAKDTTLKKVTDKVTERVTDKSQKILELIQKNPHITIQQITETVGISRKTVNEKIKHLKANGKLKIIGSDRKGYWEIS